jgi:hypothetical protein
MTEVIDPANPDEPTAADMGARIAEMVEAEAAQAEAETPTEDDEDEAGSEDEKFEQAVIEAYGRYMAEIMQLFGEDQAVTPCVFCHGFGFNPIQLAADTHSKPCEFCNGEGNVATFSKVQGNETRTCLDCKGAGYIADPIQLAPVVVPDTETAAPISQEELDEIVRKAREQAGQNVA